MSQLDKANKVKKEMKDRENMTPIVLQVVDLTHARSEEVLKFCVSELVAGTTWNELRKKLGLGYAGIDNRWRVIKKILCSAAMPKTEEDALRASYTAHNYNMSRLEDFLQHVEQRVKDKRGDKDEAGVLKVNLEAIKLQFEAEQKKFEHYAKMKELKNVDQKSQGVSVIYQNNYFIPRPGDKVKFEEGRPVLQMPAPPDVPMEKTVNLALELSDVEDNGKNRSRE